MRLVALCEDAPDDQARQLGRARAEEWGPQDAKRSGGAQGGCKARSGRLGAAAGTGSAKEGQAARDQGSHSFGTGAAGAAGARASECRLLPTGP